MRTPEELVALVTLATAAACAAGARGATRDLRHVYEAGAELELSPWLSTAPLAYEPNTLSLRRRFDALSPSDYEPRRQPFYRIRHVFGDPFVASNSAPAAARTRIADGLLTFGAQTPDPRLQRAIPILIVRQLPVDAFFDGSQPPPPPPPQPSGAGSGAATLAAGLLTFGATSPPPASGTATPPPLAWWRSPPPVQVAVRPRLAEAAAETLAVGSSPLVARLHGPVAMGSGGVGYARLADGRLAIGSGSIGFAQFDVLSVAPYV